MTCGHGGTCLSDLHVSSGEKRYPNAAYQLNFQLYKRGYVFGWMRVVFKLALKVILIWHKYPSTDLYVIHVEYVGDVWGYTAVYFYLFSLQDF